MSRALDAETTSSLPKTNPRDVYNAIAAILCPEPPSLIEIEFLGKSHPLEAGTHFLKDGKNVAIPKSKLVQAWIYARRLFFEHLKPCPENLHEELWKATAVILLMDPEHLTAANARKRVLLSYQSLPGFEERLRRELLFVDSYLTSRLHRHTKSPTLWSHRKWLLEKFKQVEVSWDVEGDLDVVLVAAERHPRNYYAWLHLRWLVQTYGEETDFDGVLQRVKTWCLKHPGDTSGFSFLQFHLDFLDASGEVGKDTRSVILQEVFGLTRTFKWTHESVWVFLRTLVAAGGEGEQSRVFLEVNSFLIGASTEDVKATKVLQAALQWYERNERS